MKKVILSLLAAATLVASAFAVDEIQLMNYAQPQEKAILDKVVKHYEDTHPGTKVKFISVTGDEYASKIQALLASNQLPDVFYLGPESVRQYVDNGKVLNLRPYIKDEQIADIYPSAIDAYRYDGQQLGKGDAIWALPKDFGPFALAYNVDLFKKFGVKLPDPNKPYTWKEFIQVCEKLTNDTNKDGQNDTFGTGLNIHWAFIQFVWGNNTDFIDSTKTKVNITDPAFIESLQFWANMTLGGEIDGYKFKPVTPSATQAQSLDTYQRWLKGELGFFPAGPWDLAAFNNTLEFEYDLIPWPIRDDSGKYETHTYRGGVGWAVSATTKNPEKAAELALYLSADYEANKMFCDQDLQVPNLKSLASEYANKGKPKNRQEYINIIEKTGKPWPYDSTYNRLWYDNFYVGVQKVLDGKMTAEEYCTLTAPKLQKNLDQALARARQSAARNRAKAK